MPNPPNVYEQRFEYDETDPSGYRAGVTRIGRAAGGSDLVVKQFEIPPGETLCPYHYEYEEEWLLVLDGNATVRTPDGEQAAPRGALMCFPAGPTGAHKVANAGDETVLALMWSSAREPSVSVYPDSDKVGVWAGEDHVLLRRSDGHVDYYDGER
ncbi:MAG: cupin domain-containing protein [Solirubrobacteraceae bacterium]